MRELENEAGVICTAEFVRNVVREVVRRDRGDANHAFSRDLNDHDTHHDMEEIAWIFMAAFFFLVASVVIDEWRASWASNADVSAKNHHEEHTAAIPKERCFNLLALFFGYCFAWTALSGGSWVIYHFKVEHGWTEIYARIIHAFILSEFCVVLVFLHYVFVSKSCIERFPRGAIVLEDTLALCGVVAGVSWEPVLFGEMELLSWSADAEECTSPANASCARLCSGEERFRVALYCLGVLVVMLPTNLWIVIPRLYYTTHSKDES